MRIRIAAAVLLLCGWPAVASAFPVGTLSPTEDMDAARYLHTATRLLDGRVLVAGAGLIEELYDPAAGTFSPTGSMAVAKALATATLLPDGRVLVA